MAKIVGINTKVLKKGDPEPPLVPGKARLYSMRFCPWAERVLLCAAEKGIDLEVVNIDLIQKPEWYFKKNPLGKVPSFEKDGQIVIESGVIPEYLDAIYPESAILPTDPYLRAKQRILLEHATPIMTSFYGLNAVHSGKLNDNEKAAKIKAVEDALDLTEKLRTDKYFGGASAGYVDWLLLPIYERVANFSEILQLPNPFPSNDRWPRLSAWFHSIVTLPTAEAAMQPRELHKQFFNTFVIGKSADGDVGL